MVDVVVAIPTFRRPKSLGRLLDAIERQSTSANVSVLVADNDAVRHAGADLCAARAPAYRWPLTAMIVAERGIAQVRNSLIACALERPVTPYIAMIDDDEWPSTGWIDAFLQVQQDLRADVLQGSIVFPDVGKHALAHCDGLVSIRRPTGPVPMLQGAGNLLIAPSCLERIDPPWFDPQFGLSGGEDREFFVRLAKAGMHFAWADQAIAYSEVPPERMTLAWVLARAYGIGNSDMRVALKHGDGIGTVAREWAKIAAAILVSPILSLAFLATPERRFEGPRLFFRALGKAAAILGRHPSPYAVGHGD